VFERGLNEAERVLGGHREQLVPVKEVWEQVSHLAAAEGFEVAVLADFSALLEGDRRFEMIPAQGDPAGGTSGLSEGEESEEGDMEKLGFFPEDRVRLRRFAPRREPNAEEEEIVSLPRVAPLRTPKKPAAAPKTSAARRPPPPKSKKKSPPAPKRRDAPTRGRKRNPARKTVRTVSRRRTVARRGRKK
jgi:hypothetical protein